MFFILFRTIPMVLIKTNKRLLCTKDGLDQLLCHSQEYVFIIFNKSAGKENNDKQRSCTIRDLSEIPQGSRP